MLVLSNKEIDSLLTGMDWKSLPMLSDMVTGRVKGRETDDQITGFVNNVGLEAQFAAVGARVYEAVVVGSDPKLLAEIERFLKKTSH